MMSLAVSLRRRRFEVTERNRWERSNHLSLRRRCVVMELRGVLHRRVLGKRCKRRIERVVMLVLRRSRISHLKLRIRRKRGDGRRYCLRWSSRRE